MNGLQQLSAIGCDPLLYQQALQAVESCRQGNAQYCDGNQTFDQCESFCFPHDIPRPEVLVVGGAHSRDDAVRLAVAHAARACASFPTRLPVDAVAFCQVLAAAVRWGLRRLSDGARMG